MIEEGVLDDIDYLYGVHVRPIQETQNGRCAPSILHGSSQHIEGTIIGEEAHGARPHLGKNSIEIAAFLVHKLGLIHIDPQIPHTVKMTKLQAGGESSNIIPGKASFSLDLRAQTNEAMEALIAETERAQKRPPLHSAQKSSCKKNTAFLRQHKTKKLKRSWQKPLQISSGLSGLMTRLSLPAERISIFTP